MMNFIQIEGLILISFDQCSVYVPKKLYEEASQVANDAVGNIRTVAAFCAEEKVMKLYQKKCTGPIQTGIRQGLVSGTGFGLSLFFLFSVYACSFYAGAKLVEKGKTSISDVFRVSYCPIIVTILDMKLFTH